MLAVKVALLVLAPVAALELGGEVAWYDPSGSLFFSDDMPSSECVCDAMALGEWASRLGAPAQDGGAQSLPVADVLEPLESVTLVVVPVARAEEVSSVVRTVPEVATTKVAAAKLRDVAEGFLQGPVFADKRRNLKAAPGVDVSLKLADAAFRRFSDTKRRDEAHPLSEALDDAGAQVEYADEQVSKITVGQESLEMCGPNKRFLGELAAVLEQSSEGGGARVFYVSRLADVTDRAAGLAFLNAALSALHTATAASSERSLLAVAAVSSSTELRDDVTVRRLDDNATTASPSSYYELAEVRQFQLNMWTAIVLILVLAAAIAAFATMNPEYDSLLYATFQANVTPTNKIE